MAEKGQDFRKSKFKVNEEKGVITLQTDQLAVQAIFSSPLLQTCSYQEQLEKYHYRAALSGLNLKVHDFDHYFSKVRQRVDQLYFSLLHRSLSIFQDLLVAAKFAKIELWHQEVGIANGLRTNLYLKQADPYCFNPSQFDKSLKQVLETLKWPGSRADEARTFISDCLDRLKQVEAEKMEGMFAGKVEEPYIARNKAGLELDPSGMFASFEGLLRIKLERSQETLFKKHFNIHEEVLRFGQATVQHSLKLQKHAALLIRKYSENYCQQAAHIVPLQQLQIRRQHQDADHLSHGKQHRSDSRPALANKQLRVEFSNISRMYNAETKQQELVEYIDSEERCALNHSSESLARGFSFETFNERRRPVFKDYYQQRQLEKRLREDTRYAFRDLKERQKQKVIVRRIYRTNPSSAPWADSSEFSSPFLYFDQTCKHKENSIWELKVKSADDDSPNHRLEKDKIFPPHLKKASSDPPSTQADAQLFECRRRKEEESRLKSLAQLISSRTHQSFLLMNKLEGQFRVSLRELQRYGLCLGLPLRESSPKEADKFFYYYFKERYYRQHESVKENADNPIIYLDSKKINMSSSLKVVSQLVGSVVRRVQSLPFFLIWSEDLIGFRLTNSEGRKVGRFECYPFGERGNCQKLLYETRRRVSIEVAQTIYEDNHEMSEIDTVMRKVEAAHRIIYNRHLPITNSQESILKGAAVAEEIIELLRKQGF